MRKFIELEPGIYVAGQIGVEDFEEINRLGIRSIVDNRPDEEVDDRISSEKIAQAASKYDIFFSYQPVWGFELGNPEHQDRIWRSIHKMSGPLLLYCRSGRRSTILWAQSAVERLGIEAVLATASSAGFDTDEILMILEERLDFVAA